MTRDQIQIIEVYYQDYDMTSMIECMKKEDADAVMDGYEARIAELEARVAELEARVAELEAM